VISNRDAVGARVKLRSGTRTLVAQRTSGGSYQSASDSSLHFGLGSSTTVDWVEVKWPSGRVDRHVGLKADTGHILREGVAKPLPRPGWKAAR
jgi:hypothetical protein